MADEPELHITADIAFHAFGHFAGEICLGCGETYHFGLRYRLRVIPVQSNVKPFYGDTYLCGSCYDAYNGGRLDLDGKIETHDQMETRDGQ